MKKLSVAYLLLGTNLGNREKRLREACNGVLREIGWLVKRSKIYETSPWNMISDSKFLNQVIIVHTILSPLELLNTCLAIEMQAGRQRSVEYTDRPIDIDILFYNDEIVNTKNLIIPHPRLHQRKFTLVPLAELCPEKRHPVFEKSMLELLDICKDNLEVTPLDYLDKK